MNNAHTNPASDHDRSSGLIPWQELGQAVRALTELNSAVIGSYSRINSNAVDNWPKMEKELLKWHKSLLHTWLDIVEQGIRSLDEAEVAAAPPPQPRTNGPEKIKVK